MAFHVCWEEDGIVWFKVKLQALGLMVIRCWWDLGQLGVGLKVGVGGV